jgi:hypothetical protein
MAAQERKKKPQLGRPATTPDAREGQLVALATNLAEQQLRDGTASAQVITHYLKHGSRRERLEQQRLENENLLTQAKIEQLQSQARVEEMYSQALKAMRTYSGNDDEDDEYDEYD